MSKIQEVADNVIAGKAKLVPGLVQEALDEGSEATDILNAMIDSMGIVGEKFKNNEIFVPEMLVAARAMKKGVDVLRPHLATGTAGAAGKVIIGTVAGDLHDIGKNLVAMMIESAGFEVIDLGVDVPAEKFIEAVKENPDVKIVGLSALLTTTMPAMKTAVEALNAQDFRSNIKIMVGGAPITAEFAAEIGADAYTPDAASAAQKAKELAA
ncbi:MAG TPA: corrinoid protein [Candidatus Blautia gallistercoris]|uniref:Corrinoid protein n=1 Tax=Candidatus Blautia gallistercoris TaxID=2838490 RepID=A0A9D1WJ48_9FIRM|nr:corrinoid protein [Candidatus Blautia gallistercoris]